jgi:peroxiredoxin Q/BCP
MQATLRTLAIALALSAPLACAASEKAASTSSMLEVGNPAPTLKTTAHDGTTVDLQALSGPTVVYFYPKDDTPGCTAEACAFRDTWERFSEAGVLVIGVSADSNESHAEFAEKHALPFPLVADPQLQWALAFGVPTRAGFMTRVSFLLTADSTIQKVYPGVDPGIHATEVLADAGGL